MQHFYRLVYRVDKNDDTGTLVERVATAIAQSGSPDHPISFLFSNAMLGRQRSALDYLIKSYPVFEPFRSAIAFPTAGASVITNVVPNGEIPEDSGIPFTTMLEVARGIPKRFPFGMATFAWRGVAALDLSASLPIADTAAGGMMGRILGRTGVPAITLLSGWGASKRSLDLTAVVRLHSTNAARGKPDLPDATRFLLESLGKRKTDDVYALPEPGEAAEQTKEAMRGVDDAFRRARAELLARIAELPLEPLETRANAEQPGENAGSVREPLADALAPLGYAPLRGAGAPGLLVFAKRTAHNDELRVSVDRGTWSHHFAGRFEIR